MEKVIEETLADGRWFPLRFENEEFRFAFIPPERHRDTAFLIHLQPPAGEMRPVAVPLVAGAALAQTELHFILHSGFGGSTLLGKLLAEPGVALSLQEPPVLTDIARWGAKRPGGESAEVLHEAARLLARPIGEGEKIVAKMTHVGNALAAGMAAERPTSQLLCLQTPLEEMLLSLAMRGLEGRSSGRRIFWSIHDSNMSIAKLSDRDLADYTDLQLAALAWLSMQKMMLDAAARLGPERVGSIETGQLMGAMRETLAAVAAHFRLELDVDARMADGALERHSKTGQPFTPEQRAERIAEGLKVHGGEIEGIVEWAHKVADKTGIAWELPYPLMG